MKALIKINLILKTAILLQALLLASSGLAIEIPANLSRPDLDEVVQILGFNTGTKFLSNPYPLGGYSGFEVGLSTEFVNSTDLSRLGAGTPKQSSFQYNRISFGKGLYNNTDLFLQFIPFSSSNEISEYGGLFKWNFYQARYLPFSISFLGHYSTINIQDSFINESLGYDLLGGINLSSFALYFGAGEQKARSTFARNVLDTGDPNISSGMNSTGTFVTRATQIHSFVGLHVNVANVFLAAQIDRYEQPVYSAKLGLRF
ncbi:MAG: hypothetical protein KDD38_03205 [Bdellovibrionales bacterium]|nr:hypothetical protein [Bdellovibrionales bacterium]